MKSNQIKPKILFAGLFGSINNPTKYASTNGSGLFIFLGNILKLIGTIAGILMVIQIITAGFDYISANGDPKKTEAAWTKIWQSLLGLIIIASAFIIASVVTRLTGIQILNPVIYAP
jgi:type IV secretory pathway VirB2 component (pilin)